jgi:hypothetical protein
MDTDTRGSAPTERSDTRSENKKSVTLEPVNSSNKKI